MSTSAITLTLYGAILGVAALAWFRGGPPERIGGLLNLIATALVLGAHLIIGPGALPTFLLVIDGLLAFGFLGLALRYASLWLGGTMLLQGVQFSLHAYYLVTDRRFDLMYAVVNNVVSWGLVTCILAGTLGVWRKTLRVKAV